MRFDDDQFNIIISSFSTKKSWFDRLSQILPILSILCIGLWSLYEYHSFTREHQGLINKQLTDQLLQMEVEKKKIENEISLSDLEIELARRRRLQQDATLKANLIKIEDDFSVYLIEYNMKLVNMSKAKVKVIYNMILPYKGSIDFTKLEDIGKVSAPNIFQNNFGATTNEFINWHAYSRIFNIMDEYKQKYLEEAKTKYQPKFIGRDGTGSIEHNEDMEISFTFYIKAKPEDWFAVFFHAKLDESKEAGDNFSHIVWNPISRILINRTESK